MEVLLTDGLLRKSLSATRSLGRKGIKTAVAENTWLTPSGFSKYCHRRIKYPDPKLDASLFIKWLKDELKERHPVFLPMDDSVMEIVMEHLEDIQQNCLCLLPSKEAYRIASNKYLTMKLAMEQKVDCPSSYLIKDVEELIEREKDISFPLILKPCKSSGSRGIRKVMNWKELLLGINEIKEEYFEVMVQEFIPLGTRYDVCLLYDSNNEVRASFVQREIRHFPIDMGPSTVQESVVYNDLIDRSVQLLKPLNWTGIVEIEFMIDSRTDTPQLMEINPRFWNSLDLAIKCGVDFPYLLYQLCKGEKIADQKVFEVGRRSRWLFPGDLLHFFLNPKRFSMSPSLFSGKKQRVYDDIYCTDDPLPGIVWLLAILKYSLSLEMWRMFFKR